MQKVLLDQENRTQIKLDVYDTYIDFYVKKGKIWKFSLSYFWKLSYAYSCYYFKKDHVRPRGKYEEKIMSF